MEIKKLEYINEEYQKAFNKFLSTSPEYEPYFSLEYNPKFLSYILIDNDEILSYIGALLINNEKAINTENRNIFEISALTLKEHRNKGFFKLLLKELIKDWETNSSFIMPVEDAFKNASFVEDYLYSEYLYVLKKEEFLANQEELSKDSLKVDHYCAFTEDHKHFYLYLPEDEDEALNEENGDVYGIEDEDVQILNACFNEEEPAGVINISFENVYASIYGVFIDEDKRNRGLGYALLYDCLEEFYKNFNYPLVLNVTSTNVAACKLYKKAGFKEASQVNFYAITSPIS